MNAFTFHSPTKVVFGKDTEMQVAAEVKAAGGSNVLLVYGGNSAKKSGLCDKVADLLKQDGIECTHFGGAQINPVLSHIRKGTEVALANKVDFILALGGGSAIDTAKAIAHATANPELDIWDDIWLGRVPLTKSMPIGVILTISAAGSETSSSAVITNDSTAVKRGCNTSLNRPVFAIMNPCLTYTLPTRHVACGVADIMMHTLDRFFAPGTNMLTDEFAAALLRTTMSCGKTLLQNPTDYDAASEIMWCGSVSHNHLTGLGRTPDFGVHALGHELSAAYDSIHGEALTAVFGAFVRYVSQKDDSRFVTLGEMVYGKKMTAEQMAVAFELYFTSLGLPISIPQLLNKSLEEDELRRMSVAVTYDGARKVGGYFKMSADEVYEIFKLANK